MPRLIGMIKMELPRIIKRREDGAVEVVAELACDDTGQLWGMVAVQESINRTTTRLYYDRWVRWDVTPFSDEVVDKDPQASGRVILRKD